jgi:hypothetical protein
MLGFLPSTVALLTPDAALIPSQAVRYPVRYGTKKSSCSMVELVVPTPLRYFRMK